MADEMPVSPQQPIVTFFNPNKRDLGLVEYWSTERATDAPIDVGTPHPNTRDYPGFKLGIQVQIEGEDSWWRRVWVTDETSPDWFNYEVKFAAEALAFPTYIRQYRIEKKTYSPITKGLPLDSVFMVRKLTAGSGYVPGTFPAVTASGGGGTGFSGHGIVNLDGTIADFVIDEQGTGFTSTPTLSVEDPPIGVTATAQAVVQPQSAVLIAEQAEEFPKDSEFFGLYFNVTRVYETLPGPTLESTEIEEDGMTKVITHTRGVAADIVSSEVATSPGLWIKTTKKETGNLYVAEQVQESRPLPGNPIPFTRLDDDGVVVTASKTLGLGADIVSTEVIQTGVWVRTFKKEVTDKVAWQVQESRTIPGPLQEGEQTGKWGVELVKKQKVVLATTDVDEGYLVKESKFDPIDGSNLVATKVTVFYPVGLYGVALEGQDYDPRLDAVIPYVNKLQPISYGIGVNREDITPVDYEHAEVRTIDPATVQAVLDAYVFSYPGRINIDMPDILTRIDAVIETSTSDGADQETGASTLVGNGSLSQSLTAQAQASANAIPEAFPTIKQFWGNNIACQHYHFFLPNPVNLSDVTAKLNSLLTPDTVSDWPKFNPEIVTLVMTGGRVSVQSKAHSQGSYAISGTGEASTSGGGTGYSEERGLTVKTLRISPTIHAELTVEGDVYGTESVSSTAYAECAGLGPLETQNTGPLSVTAQVTPTTIPATVGATTWPTSGLFLYRADPHPYRYGYIEFHCVVVNAEDFPSTPSVEGLYVQFKVNVHDIGDPGDFIHLGSSPTNFVAAYHSNGSSTFSFYENNGGNFSDSSDTFPIDSWYTLDMRISFSGGDATITPRVNGVELSPFTSSGLVITEVDFGSLLGNLIVNDHELDDLRIGTTGWGSSDLFSADFSTTISPPFDSQTGTGISIVGGRLVISNAGTDAYAIKALSYP